MGHSTVDYNEVGKRLPFFCGREKREAVSFDRAHYFSLKVLEALKGGRKERGELSKKGKELELGHPKRLEMCDEMR